MIDEPLTVEDIDALIDNIVRPHMHFSKAVDTALKKLIRMRYFLVKDNPAEIERMIEQFR
jgi:hypothetical protein